MNCKFCNKETRLHLLDFHSNFYRCDQCSVIYETEDKSRRLIQHYFVIEMDSVFYRIHIWNAEFYEPHAQVTRIHNAKQSFIDFNYIPDINPLNVKDWLNRVVNLKAFI